MKICVRTDASVELGTGHVMSCLTLALSLREKGCDVTFLCRRTRGNLIEFLEKKGFTVRSLPDGEVMRDFGAETGYFESHAVTWQTDANDTLAALRRSPMIDWIIVDHYSLDRKWEKKIRPQANKTMVIDDLADRHHDCDLLLDQNLHFDMENRYRGLVPDRCTTMLGPRYALLRREFYRARESLRVRDGLLKRILVFFGGSDPTDETTKTLEALRLLGLPGVRADVVVGATNPRKKIVESICSALPSVNFHYQIESMAYLTNMADLAIGGGGSTTWERCFLGLPSLTVVVAENQREISEAVAAAGASRYLGHSKDVTSEILAASLRLASENSAMLREMSEKALSMMGGKSSDPDNELTEKLLGEYHA